MEIFRTSLLEKVRIALSRNPVVVLIGPRQAGKATLVRKLLAEDSPNYFDLEDPVSLARLDEPRTALEPLQGLIVIDEIQRRPDLFPILRVLADRRGSPARFLILGSASGELMRQSGETLAGRMERVEIGGFGIAELGAEAVDTLWRRVGSHELISALAPYLGDVGVNSPETPRPQRSTHPPPPRGRYVKTPESRSLPRAARPA